MAYNRSKSIPDKRPGLFETPEWAVRRKGMATFYGSDWPDLIDGTSRRDVIYGFGSDDDL
jgi:hypothetical protein